MRGILQIYKSFSGKLTAFMVFSLFVSGCHTGDEPGSVPRVTVKKEATNHNQTGGIQADTIVKTRKKIPETPVNHSASGILLPDKKANKSRINTPAQGDKNPDIAARRNPFAMPAALRNQQTVSLGNQIFVQGKTQASLRCTTVQQPAAPSVPGSQEPCVTGIFDNGKEKLALLHWQQIQGPFHRGESLGNGYYIKEITAAAVLLYPEKNDSGIKPITLTLRQ